MRMIFLSAALLLATPVTAQDTAKPDPALFQPVDVFDLEYAADPQVSPDGKTVVYVRRSFDRMKDQARSNLWMVDIASGAHRPLLSGTTNYSSPRWSPDGKRLAYVTSADQGAQIYVRWMDTGATARLTDLQKGPSGLSWSPDGRTLAFAMFVKDEPEPLAKMPAPPEGASWAEKPTVIDRISYRGDGAGYYEQGVSHIFTVSAEGGTPRQVTKGDFDFGGTAAWTRDGRSLIVAADLNPDWRRGDTFSDIYRVDVRDGAMTRLRENAGPDIAPTVSPDGRRIAWLGYTDNLKAYQPFRLWSMNVDGSDARQLASATDRTINGIEWSADSRNVVFSYDSNGDTVLARADLSGGVTKLADGLGGESLGRPYSGSSFSVADQAGTIVANITTPTRPADLAVLRGSELRQLTRLNDDVAAVKRFADAEEIWTTAADGTRSQSWIVKPPNFDPARKYPMILEIHGGPHTNYGARFSAEVQAYAAAGYVVVYSNPRGSTSYGEDFALMIDKAYPGGDYDDLMAAVDGVIAKGYIDTDQLFVTGGSGGGVLTAWIVGKTDRFRAAVVAKPVINWTSFVLTADGIPYFAKYWMGAMPWENQAEYWRRSPLSLVGNVKTPTMLLTGEDDYRTPMSETEQYYGALQLAGVETAMVRIKGAGHGIANRPSNLMNKVGYILAWFEKYRGGEAGEPAI